MTTLDTLPETSAPAARPKRSNVTGRAFLAILRRDLFVSGKEFWVLLLQVALTPLFMLFIFAKVLTSAGYVTSGYGNLLLAGSIALSSFLTALQSVAFPLVMEFGWTKEIEDRLLAPLPLDLVTVEKLVMATLRGFFAGVVIYPIGALVLTGAPWNPSGLPLLAAALILGAWTGAGIGITIGTLVPPAKISFLFAAILTPLMFTGATQYPWSSLSDRRWFQVITAFNPMTYCAEAVRAALIPHEVPHINTWLCLLALLASSAIFTATGVWSFRKRAYAG